MGFQQQFCNGLVMPGLVPATHALLLRYIKEDVDARDKPGHAGN
jgi:hypothetical protein